MHYQSNPLPKLHDFPTGESLSIIEVLDRALKNGQLKLAAGLLVQIAREPVDQNKHDALLLVAHEFQRSGDRHLGPGRPRKGLGDEMALVLLARSDLELAIIARCFADGDRIGPKTLVKVLRFLGRRPLENPRIEYESYEQIEERLRADPELLREVTKQNLDWTTQSQQLRSDPRFDLKLLKKKRPRRKTGVDLQKSVPRRGFRTQYRIRIAEHYDIDPSTLRGVAPKVDE
jgi:hypothetical protein